ncbi:hypothetical protein AK830_g6518 [Neonectria ditissima]|uniref:G-protein coupled receptors family 2 profile 2 domain-containing protein n=1 Tax=Neonectria ditissima TaxID=78410 RepID=A0A0P7B1R7_9HYPO|nr:hypothetical protein AK830_g6518 [Neonectria ditissima]
MPVHTLLAARAEVITMTPEQARTLTLLERIGGTISLVAVLLLFAAYAAAPRVRNVQNTFIVFASIANIGASVASIIAMDGLQSGTDSALCQGQGFLFQMFMQSDPWWSLAMAFNVFLVFFFRTSPDAFRKWWWLYCLICYGGPFVISLSLVLVRTSGRGPVFGQATAWGQIWCWVDHEWENIRIYSYYMLVWICIVGSLLFYFLVGYQVFRTRNRLKSFSVSKSREAGTYEQQQLPRVDLLVPQDCFYGTIVTEVQVVQSTASPVSGPEEPRPPYTQSSPHVSFDEALPPPIHAAPSNYYSTATSAACAPARSRRPLRRITNATSRTFSKFLIEDHIKRAYLRTSFLFALSVLVTWIPSSMNRIHSWLVGDSPFEYHVATAAVLPLQGLWNSTIFFITSNRALRQTWRDRNDTCDMVEAGAETAVPASPDTRTGRAQSFLDDTDSGSDVELRRMAEAPGKRSASL